MCRVFVNICDAALYTAKTKWPNTGSPIEESRLILILQIYRFIGAFPENSKDKNGHDGRTKVTGNWLDVIE